MLTGIDPKFSQRFWLWYFDGYWDNDRGVIKCSATKAEAFNRPKAQPTTTQLCVCISLGQSHTGRVCASGRCTWLCALGV